MCHPFPLLQLRVARRHARFPRPRHSRRTRAHTPPPPRYSHHVAPQCKHQTSHPPRVLSSQRHSFLRCSRCSPRCRRRRAHHPALACAVGWNAAVAGEEGGQRETASTQQSTGEPIRARPHPGGEPRASCHQLPAAPPWRAAEIAHAGEPPDAATLRTPGAGSEADAHQEAHSRRA